MNSARFKIGRVYHYGLVIEILSYMKKKHCCRFLWNSSRTSRKHLLKTFTALCLKLNIAKIYNLTIQEEALSFFVNLNRINQPIILSIKSLTQANPILKSIIYGQKKINILSLTIDDHPSGFSNEIEMAKFMGLLHYLQIQAIILLQGSINNSKDGQQKAIVLSKEEELELPIPQLCDQEMLATLKCISIVLKREHNQCQLEQQKTEEVEEEEEESKDDNNDNDDANNSSIRQHQQQSLAQYIQSMGRRVTSNVQNSFQTVVTAVQNQFQQIRPIQNPRRRHQRIRPPRRQFNEYQPTDQNAIELFRKFPELRYATKTKIQNNTNQFQHWINNQSRASVTWNALGIFENIVQQLDMHQNALLSIRYSLDRFDEQAIQQLLLDLKDKSNPFSKLKVLGIDCDFIQELLIAVLHMLPNLQSLQIQQFKNKVVKRLANADHELIQRPSNIKYLFINDCDTEVYEFITNQAVYFSNLQSIELKGDIRSMSVTSVLNTFNNLRNVDFSNMIPTSLSFQEYMSFIGSLTELKQLEVLAFNTFLIRNDVAIQQFLMDILPKFTNLRKLSLKFYQFKADFWQSEIIMSLLTCTIEESLSKLRWIQIIDDKNHFKIESLVSLFSPVSRFLFLKIVKTIFLDEYLNLRRILPRHEIEFTSMKYRAMAQNLAQEQYLEGNPQVRDYIENNQKI